MNVAFGKEIDPWTMPQVGQLDLHTAFVRESEFVIKVEVVIEGVKF
ncbi:hypothetical protein HMPREF0497_0388 [Lentilactobacillus buchneri ATCC 11577]|nr:hypothetical protein HMPREF0497_0388 [Lentilactobacillus buchneri ATCC 11577]